MRKPAAILLVVPMLTACGSSVAASAAPSVNPPSNHPARCGPASARTLAGSAAARVYVSGGSVYGCSSDGHKQYRLGGRRTCLVTDRVGPVAVAGGLAAYGLMRCGVDTASASIALRRLSDGKVLLSDSAITRVPGPESFQSVTSVVARPDGAVAWISVVSSILVHRAVVEVHRSDARGQALLDSGAAITAGSLRLRGSTVTWRDHGATRSATLR